MCPLCLSTLAWLALGGSSAVSAAVLLAGLNLKGRNDGDADNDASDCHA
jgi:hypothetical protein